MADEKDKIAKLEERLEKAATTFKEMKTQLDAEKKANEELTSRVAELEDELTLNGGAAEEVEGLKGRLEKAKEIFATQKAKIAELNMTVDEKDQTLKEVQSDLDAAVNTCSELTKKVNALEQTNLSLTNTVKQIKEIVCTIYN